MIRKMKVEENYGQDAYEHLQIVSEYLVHPIPHVPVTSQESEENDIKSLDEQNALFCDHSDLLYRLGF